MKHLTIIRHSKAADYRSSQTDHDRPLSTNGITKAEFISEFLVEKTERPDLIISSTAARALTTARIFAARFAYPMGAIVEEPQLYDFGGYTRVMAILRAIEGGVGSVMLFGHNPTFTALAWHLCKAFRHEMPTSACVGLELPVQDWGTIQPDEAGLRFFYTRPIIRRLLAQT